MPRYQFRLLNVFAESTFGGNPLCVFEDGSGLSDTQMLMLARQFNLSETAFLLPSGQADAALRIFTPTGELPFAGHPTLGAADVARKMGAASRPLQLDLRAGTVSVTQQDDRWTLTAARCVDDAGVRFCETGPAELCRMLGIGIDDIAADPCWIDTGSEQLLIALTSNEAVRRAKPGSEFSAHWPANARGRRNVLMWAFGQHQHQQANPSRHGLRQAVAARYFFAGTQGVVEDPGTGSAAANLGAWLAMHRHAPPLAIDISQGDAIDRPCRLSLDVTLDGRIMVGGRVIEIGNGGIELQPDDRD
jgi:PhzF family phenazine biosynthesis protein